MDVAFYCDRMASFRLSLNAKAANLIGLPRVKQEVSCLRLPLPNQHLTFLSTAHDSDEPSNLAFVITAS